MSRRLSSMHARAICHATEEATRVEAALRAVVGDSEVERSKTEGHHGNAIEVLEASVEDEGRILDMMRGIVPEDLGRIESTLDTRVDDACQLHLRFDKQEAFKGRLRLSIGEDVVAVRVKVRAFPAKPEVAAAILKDLLQEIASTGDTDDADA